MKVNMVYKTVPQIAVSAKSASLELAGLSSVVKNTALEAMAFSLEKNLASINSFSGEKSNRGEGVASCDQRRID